MLRTQIDCVQKKRLSMKKLILTLASVCISFSALARPYLSEYRDGWMVIIFHGNIRDEDEPIVRALQTKYLEALDTSKHYPGQYRMELERLGVFIEKMPNDPYIQSDQAQPYYSPGQGSPYYPPSQK